MAVEELLIDPYNEAAWIDLRRSVIGASEIATVLGLGKFGSLAQLVADKKGVSLKRSDDDPMLDKGKWFEPAVFRRLAHERPHWNVAEASYFFRDLDRYLGATPDGFALRPDKRGKGVVEAKVITKTVFRERWLIDPQDSIRHGECEVPVYYRLQVLQQMLLTEVQWGALAVMVADEYGAYALRVFDIEHEQYWEQKIVDEAARFRHDYIEGGLMPPFDMQLDSRLVKAMYPRDDGSVVDLTANNIAPALVDQLIDARSRSAKAEKEKDAVSTELAALMREHTYGILADGRVLRSALQHRKAEREPRPATSFRVLKVLPELPAHVREQPIVQGGHTYAEPDDRNGRHATADTGGEA